MPKSASTIRELLEKHAISCSMSAKGYCWDNAEVESFFSTFKLELGLDDDKDVLITPPGPAESQPITPRLLESRSIPKTKCFIGLGDRHPQLPGVEGDLRHKALRSVLPTHPRDPQRLAVADQLGDFPSLRSDPLQHPAPEHGEQLGQIHPLKQVQEGGVGGRALPVKAENGIERPVMTGRKPLQILAMRQPLKIPRMATSSRNHWGLRIPRSLRPSGRP